MSVLLSIRKSFTQTPGPRLKEEGDFSGELFRETILKPAFEEALKKGDTLVVDLDGTEGYATSFLEEAFGGLARAFTSEQVAKVVRLNSQDEPFLVAEIEGYIKNAND